MRSVTITKLPNGAKGITEFEKLTVSPKPRAEGSNPSAPATSPQALFACGGFLCYTKKPPVRLLRCGSFSQKVTLGFPTRL